MHIWKMIGDEPNTRLRNYEYIFVKKARSKLCEQSNFIKLGYILLRNKITINFEHCDFFSRATYFILNFKEKIHSIDLKYSLVSSKHFAICLLKMALEHSSVAYF